jgi:hypothetical protein
MGSGGGSRLGSAEEAPGGGRLYARDRHGLLLLAMELHARPDARGHGLFVLLGRCETPAQGCGPGLLGERWLTLHHQRARHRAVDLHDELEDHDRVTLAPGRVGDVRIAERDGRNDVPRRLGAYRRADQEHCETHARRAKQETHSGLASPRIRATPPFPSSGRPRSAWPERVEKARTRRWSRWRRAFDTQGFRLTRTRATSDPRSIRRAPCASCSGSCIWRPGERNCELSTSLLAGADVPARDSPPSEVLFELLPHVLGTIRRHG